METVTLARVELLDRGLWALTDKIEKLNKRAKRCGVKPITLTVVRQWTTKHPKSGCDVENYDVEINGIAPRINGWALVARIENNETIGTVVRVVPGPFEDDDYSGYRDHDFSCDHCNTNRRRNDVFVLKNDDGFEKVIGRNCLADYLRVEDADAFARYAEFCEQCSVIAGNGDPDEPGEFGGKGYRPNIRLESFLSVVQCCTRRLGWTSRSEAYNDPDRTATADDAYFVIYGSGEYHDKFIKEYELEVSDGDRDLAGRAVEWAASLTEEDTARSEYLDTVRRIAQAGETDEKLSGFAASIIRAFEKAQQWETERAEKAAGRKERDYIGKIGKAQDLGVVTVVGLHYFNGAYGTTTIVRMMADLPDGKIAPIVWFCSGSKEFEVDAQYKLRAGVKGQNDDPKYGKQTVVSRAKLVPVVA